MINLCIACGDVATQNKLCSECHLDWKESNLGYAYWLITLPTMPEQMAKMVIKSGRAKTTLQNSLLNVVYSKVRAYGAVPPSQFNIGNSSFQNDPSSLANTANKRLW